MALDEFSQNFEFWLIFIDCHWLWLLLRLPPSSQQLHCSTIILICFNRGEDISMTRFRQSHGWPLMLTVARLPGHFSRWLSAQSCWCQWSMIWSCMMHDRCNRQSVKLSASMALDEFSQNFEFWLNFIDWHRRWLLLRLPLSSQQLHCIMIILICFNRGEDISTMRFRQSYQRRPTHSGWVAGSFFSMAINPILLMSMVNDMIVYDAWSLQSAVCEAFSVDGIGWI